MGHLIYANSASYDFDDRVLAHLRVVIGSRLRRRESFFLSWTTDAEHGSGRRTVWLSPDVPLAFHFSSAHPVRLNREWLDVLSQLAHSVDGLTLVSEEQAHGMHGSLLADKREYADEG
ncbi:hypothetical protein SAMN04489806_2106 [Paramicrobacterium humi]|uniref:DUF7882 domain-containing protein n=1 Tax=Paramicrobacterium humi TaxID=640635 RepID=A0A1H4N792_9MICO|nr:hypothetical protein [Microbacterium humi]SEB91179.1 hypothetical protein SAMN04489806_2106 [Microbacterium humi]